MNTRFKLNKLIKGDMKYFADIYTEYYDKVYFIALNILKNEQDSEDITQEVFTQVYKSIKNLDDVDKFNAWISRIAVSKSIDSIRKKKRINDKELYSDYDFNNIDSGENIESNLIDYEKSKLILSLVQQLPEKKRIVLTLFYYNGLKIDEIAKVIDCPVGTVKSRLNSAKKDLKILLTKQDKVKFYGLALPTLLISMKFIKFHKMNNIYFNPIINNICNIDSAKYNMIGELTKYKKIIYTMIISSSCIVSSGSNNYNITNLNEYKSQVVDENSNSQNNFNTNMTLEYLVTDSDGNKTIETRKITIEKDRPPQIFGVDNITIKKGENFNCTQGVYVKDDNDVHIETSVNGFVDTNKIGVYKLEYTAKDSSGNVTKEIRKIKVKK